MDLQIELGRVRIVPTIAISHVDKAVPLARALMAGGLPCAEVTFRTAEAAEAIRRINADVPDILLGAGTVLTTKQVDQALEAGAKFIVAPGFNPRVVDHCLAKGVPILPGCITPSEMEQALERGLTTVKFFPAEASGGLDFINAVSAPYPMMRFVPTGGVGPGNVAGYLANPKVIAVGGTWMVKKDLIAAGDFAAVTRLSREALELLK